MRLKNDTNNFAASFNITPPYQMLVLHSKMLIYPRELYQRGVQRKRVEMIAADFNEYVANELIKYRLLLAWRKTGAVIPDIQL